MLKFNGAIAKKLIGLHDIERNLLKPNRTIKQNIEVKLKGQISYK